VFCEIVAGDRPAHTVLRGPAAAAFLDHAPLFPGHVLVVPLLHRATLADLPAEEIEPYFAVVQRIAEALPAALGCDGSFVAMNNVVSQSVPHLHTHVVPRTRGDGLRGFFWPRSRYADEATAAEIALRLADALGAS
jgi:histidine triad (HIT) family protein